MIKESREFLIKYFSQVGISDFYSELIAIMILVFAVILLGFIIDRIARQVLLSGFTSLAKKSKTNWDDLLVENKVFSAIAHLAPVIVIFYLLPGIFGGHPTLVDYTARLNEVVIILTAMVVVFRFLNTVRDILNGIEMFKDKPLQSYFQLVKIIIGIVLAVLILSVIADKSILYFFGAFGAVSAVLLLVFKDTILGFIASIQLAANDMIKVGDWVQMDRYGADGDVIEINLTTVKVKNWDKTITTVPTYSFISDSFKNWRGMAETGSRRIARSIYINQHSVKFCGDEMIERFKNIHILKPYVEERLEAIKQYNEERKIDTSQVSNGRRMTNLGTFRAYLLKYLHNHPKINQDLTILVRQLAPTEHGIPIQLYAFCNDIAWANYEEVQSDIFDHTLAVIHQFDLEIFQDPSGSDFKKALS
ncbi:MAG: mechanosensitive ion channel [Vicingaceae bacterium]